jgi:glycerol-3-phosphate dehydrogenase
MAKREHITDIFVIGGGINGTAIARDAAGRGYSVFLAEMGDLAGGASSSTTKLLHSGTGDLGHLPFGRTSDALAEREVLWTMAPHLVRPLRFVLSHHKGLRPAWLLRAGLFVHDIMGSSKLLPPTRTLDLRNDPLGRPLKDGYALAFESSECWVDDARVVALTARDAADKGAIIQTRTKVTSATREGDLWTIRLRDTTTSLRGTVKARLIVNAAGAWVDTVLREALGKPEANNVRLVKESHIVVRRLFDHEQAYAFRNGDKRLVFAVPYQRDYTLIGATVDEFAGDPHDAAITEDEINGLLAAATEYFERPVTRGDIAWSFSGVYPLFVDPKSKSGEGAHDHVLTSITDAKADALINVFGGKLNTHRRIAEQVTERVEASLGKRGKPWTRTSKLPGGEFAPGDFDLQVERLNGLYPNLADRFLRRLAGQYGTHAATLLGTATRMSDLGELFGADLTQREVEYLIEREWARTADDILWRRTKLGLRMRSGDRVRLEEYLRTRKRGTNN